MPGCVRAYARHNRERKRLSRRKYTYDAVGNRLTTNTYYNGSSIATTSLADTYDSNNRLESVSDGSGLVAAYSYDRAGNRLTFARGNGVVTQYAYDSLNRVTDVVNSVGSTYHYVLEPDGKRISVTDSSGTTNFSYDADGRLTQESGPAANTSYSYDAVGNRLSKTSSTSSISYSYDADDRLVSRSDQAGPITYDADGNQTTVNGELATYDQDNRLVMLGDVSNPVVTYVYDANGNRVQMTAGNVVNYLVDPGVGSSSVIEERDGSGNLIARYDYGVDLIRMDRAEGISYNISYYIYDGHNSTRALTDANGKITDTYTYDSYGNLLFATGSTPNTYLFDAQEQDSSTSLYYLRARYYDQTTGRFLSQDPLGGDSQSPVSLERYLFCDNDPVNFTDSSGQEPTMLAVVVVFAVGAVIGAIATGVSEYALTGHFSWSDVGIGALIGGVLGVGGLYLAPLVPAAALGQIVLYSTAADVGISGGLALAVFADPTTTPGERIAAVGLIIFSAATPALLKQAFGNQLLLSALAGGDSTGSDAGATMAAPNLGDGNIFTHFTNGASVRGITGIDPATLDVGQQVTVRGLNFGTGINPFQASSAGSLFATDLPYTSNALPLALLGVTSESNEFAITASQEAFLANGIRPVYVGGDVASHAVTFPANSTLTDHGFDYLVTRVR